MMEKQYFKTEQGIYLDIEFRLTFISNFLEESGKAFNKYIQGELAQISEDIDRGEYPKNISKDDLQHLEDTMYSDIMPYFVLSYVILATAEFEKSIKKVCGKLKDRYKLITDLEDFRRKKGIGLVDAARKYLTDHGKFQSPEIQHWKSIKDIYLIRNIIVHNELEYEKLRKNLKEAVDRIAQKKCGIKIEPDSFAEFLTKDENYQPNPTKIKIDWKFCEYTIKEVMTFFNKLQKEHLERLFGSIKEVQSKTESREK